MLVFLEADVMKYQNMAASSSTVVMQSVFRTWVLRHAIVDGVPVRQYNSTPFRYSFEAE
jgi:hypothetical protein